MAESSWFRWWMVPAAIPVAAAALCGVTCLVGGPCGGLYWRYGVWQMGSCPSGEIRAGGQIRAWNLLRGSDEGRVAVSVHVRWMADGEDSAREAQAWRGSSVQLALLDEKGEEVDGFVADAIHRDSEHQFEVTLPGELQDGDYTLRATVGIAGEELVVDAPLALYAPALAHTALDRPLYEPGQEVHLRSVLLRRTDQAPLSGRPGRWEVRDPQGVLVHAEKDRSGPWGIADSTFYLASDAPVGTWSATWKSADAEDRVSFDVRPFTLPRFTVEASPEDRWFHPGEVARLSGTARYTSGAPVQSAPVRLQLGVAEGRWPLPLAWERTFEAQTDAQGRFELEIGTIPEEELLTRELSVLGARVQVTDETGEAQSGGTRLVISADDVRAEVLTELDGGLVGGFNNRAWLRVTTPDGVPVRKASLVVGNPFEEGAKGYEAETDIDGVAMLQLDPGDPISIPMPPVPVRSRPPTPGEVRLSRSVVLPGGGGPSLPERRVLDRLHAPVAACGDFSTGTSAVEVALQVDAGGRARSVLHDEGRVNACVGEIVRGARFPAGTPRVLATTWLVPDSLRPSFPAAVSSGGGDASAAQAAITDALLEARRCVARGRGRRGAEVLSGTWRQRAGQTRLEFDVGTGASSALSAGELGCIRRTLEGAEVSAKQRDAVGSVVVRLQRPGEAVQHQAQATFTTGYPVGVAAKVDGSELGTTLAVVGVGSVPPLRIRMTPSLPMPGDTVTVDFLRGPDFYGTFPEKVSLMQGGRRVSRVNFPEKGKKQVQFDIPADTRGFVTVDVNGARGVAFVQEPNPLALSLSTDRDAYAPGEEAKLMVKTTAGAVGVPAAVGLMGVDESLGQLAPLLGPDDLGRVTVRATSDTPAFGAFDARALALGQIRGENAATAAVLSLTHLPSDPAGDTFVSTRGQATVDDLEVVTRRFWRTRTKLVERVRAWEDAAPEGEELTHERLAKLWTETVMAQESAGTPARDAFQRPLTLNHLPRPLVERLDPREIASDATRLPEDVTPWMTWVAEEVRS